MRRLLLLSILLLPWSAAQAPAKQAQKEIPEAQDGVTLRREPGLTPGVKAVLGRLPTGVRGTVLVREIGGRVVESVQPDRAMIPASSLKLVTGAAVLFDRGGAEGWWSTELTIPAAQVGRSQVKAVTLRGSGDPTLRVSGSAYSLRALAEQVRARGVQVVGAVRVDDARLDSTTWQGAVIGVPMTALRLAEWYDHPPDSAAQARARLGAALIAELRRAGVKVLSDGVGQAAPYTPYVPPQRQDDKGKLLPPDPVIPLERRPEQGIATVRSASPTEIVTATELPSDNLRAEELLATLAVKPAGNGTLAGALAREKAFLRQIGVDTTGIVLADGSGLSRESRLTARALVQLLVVMHDLPYPEKGKRELPDALYRQRQNAFIEALPQAGTGENVPKHDGRGGTMALRLVGSDLDVRAKTGTLPGVSCLAGYVTGKSGKTLAFAIMMNGPETAPILTLRAQQDQMVRAIAAAH